MKTPITSQVAEPRLSVSRPHRSSRKYLEPPVVVTGSSAVEPCQRDAGNPRTVIVMTDHASVRALQVLRATVGWGVIALAILTMRGQGGFQTLWTFGYTNQMVSSPQAPLIQGRDGALYGTSTDGGMAGGGTVFRVHPDGSGLVVLKHFGRSPTDGFRPDAPLLEATDGALYGTTPRGGESDLGTVFTLNKDGTGFRTLWTHASNGSLPEWAEPRAPLVEGLDGALYGTTRRGGGRERGTVFRLGKDGAGFTVIHRFTDEGGSGFYPMGSLAQDDSGRLYGTTEAGGTHGMGTLFALSKNGEGFMVLKHFEGGEDGSAPEGGLIHEGGRLYGTTQGGDGTVFGIDTNGANYRVLRRFTQADSGPWRPRGGLSQGPSGRLFGATVRGGEADRGVLFALNPDGTAFTVLKSFPMSDLDGAAPSGPPRIGSDGLLYGATERGGSDIGNWGAVYGLSPDGSGYKVLAVLSNTGGDGAQPGLQMAQGSDGALYGTTRAGGFSGRGTLFRIHPRGGEYAQLHSFLGGAADGEFPSDSLVQDASGNLYGITQTGGAAGAGTVFQWDSRAGRYALLKSLDGGTEGTHPVGLCYSSRDHVLYGTASTVFRLNPDGSGYAVIRVLNAPGTATISSVGAPVQGSDGVLYGLTRGDGTQRMGTLYRVNPDGTGFAILHEFGQSESDAQLPTGALIEGANGMLYGTTAKGGGAAGAGCIFAVHKDGSGFTVIKTLQGEDAISPAGTLVQREDGTLFGTAHSGLSGGGGRVFRLNTDGLAFAVLRDIGPVLGGLGWSGAPTLGQDGALYLTAQSGVFRLAALEPNRPPRVGTAIATQTLTMGSPFAFAIPAETFFEADVGQKLSYRVTLRDQPYLPAWLTFDPVQGLISGVPPERGVLFLTVTATDDWAPALSVSQSFALSILNPNHPPQVNRPIPDLMVPANEPFSYTFPADTFTDPDPGDTLFYDAVAILNGAQLPSGLFLPGLRFDSGARTFSGVPLNPGPAALVTQIRVIAQDTGIPRLRATNTFTLSITGSSTNHAPLVSGSISNRSIRLGQSFALTLPANTFQDPDSGQKLSYLAEGAPAGVRFDPLALAFSGVPLRAGVFECSITATDNGLPPLTATLRFTLTVQAELRILSVRRIDSDAVQLVAQGTPSLSYTIQACPDLSPSQPWTSAGEVTAEADGRIAVRLQPAAGTTMRFYRLASKSTP